MPKIILRGRTTTTTCSHQSDSLCSRASHQDEYAEEKIIASAEDRRKLGKQSSVILLWTSSLSFSLFFLSSFLHLGLSPPIRLQLCREREENWPIIF